MGDACGKLLLIILSVFIPPLAVWIARNKICSCTVCINILLTLLGWVNIFIYKRMTEIVLVFFVFKVPGVIHAWCVICCCDNLDAV